MYFLSPNQQCQRTKGNIRQHTAGSSSIRSSMNDDRWWHLTLWHVISQQWSSQKLTRREDTTYIFADIILAISEAVQFPLLLSSHSVGLSQTVLQLFQLMIKTQDFCLLFTTLSFHTVTLHGQSVKYTNNAICLPLYLMNHINFSL